MNEDMKYLVSIEEFAAFLDGNLTQEGMKRISSIVDTNKTMHDFVMSSHYIDGELTNYDSLNLSLPEELMSLDFDIPEIENVEIGDISTDNDTLYHHNINNLNDMSEEYDDLKNHHIFGEEGTDNGTEYNPYIQQAYDDTCAIRSQQIIMRDYGVDISEHDLRDIALEHGWYSPKGGTLASDVGNLLDLAGIHCHQSTNNTVYDLVSELSQGHRVIVGVDSGELWSKTFIGKSYEKIQDIIGMSHADHALIVAGVDVNANNSKDIKIVLTDPGTGDLRVEYKMKDFMDAWKDSKCFMLSTEEAAPFQFDPVTGREVPSGFHSEYSHNDFVQDNGYMLSPEAMTIPEDYETSYSATDAIDWNHEEVDCGYDNLDDIDLN